MSAVAKRYGRGVVEAAKEVGGEQAVDLALEGLTTFRDAFRQIGELRELLVNPALKDKRDDVLTAVAKKLEMDAISTTTIRLLANNDRIPELEEVVMQVEQMADELTDRVRARVITAIPLKKAQEKRVVVALEKRLGATVVLSVEEDPTILGGLKCYVGDLTIDSSVKRQLEIMGERLHAGSV